jgi:hypothetical protein
MSAIYLLLLLPHIRGIGREHFTTSWFWGAVAIACLWMPLLLLNRHFDERGWMLSFAPLLLIAAYFSALFIVAG